MMNDLNDALLLLGQKELECARLKGMVQSQAAQLKAAQEQLDDLQKGDDKPAKQAAKK